MNPNDPISAPVSDPNEFAAQLGRAWLELHPRQDREHAVPGTRFRHSDAASCDRQLSYKLTDTEPTEPLSINSLWTFRVGQLVHDDWQPALARAFPDVQLEVKGTSLATDGSFHSDGTILWPTGELDVVEVKSINGFGFKFMVGSRGKARGPRHSALVQLACNTVSTEGARGGWLVYVSIENMSVKEAAKANFSPLDRMMKVTWYSRGQLEPIAAAEFNRVNRIIDLVDSDMLGARRIPDPELPADHIVTNPATGEWQVLDDQGATLELGSTWQCEYCAFRSKCIEDGPTPG